MQRILLFTCFFVLSFLTQTEAQNFSITYPTSAQPVKVCYQNSYLTVKITAISASTNNVVKIELPTGVQYVPSSASVLSSMPSNATVSERNINNLGKPEFNLPNLSAGQFVVIRLARSADCSARTAAINGEVFKDAVLVSGSAGSFSETDVNTNTYGIEYAALSVSKTSANIANPALNASYDRIFTITNGGACTGSVYFGIANQAGISTVSVKVGNTTLTPTATISGITYYTLSASELPGGDLCNGETVQVTHRATITGCTNATSSYTANWGCSVSSQCQSPAPSVSETFVISDGTPNLVRTLVRDSKTFCFGAYDNNVVRLVNTGTGAASNIAVDLAASIVAITSYNSSMIDGGSITWQIGANGTATAITATNTVSASGLLNAPRVAPTGNMGTFIRRGLLTIPTSLNTGDTLIIKFKETAALIDPNACNVGLGDEYRSFGASVAYTSGGCTPISYSLPFADNNNRWGTYFGPRTVGVSLSGDAFIAAGGTAKLIYNDMRLTYVASTMVNTDYIDVSFNLPAGLVYQSAYISNAAETTNWTPTGTPTYNGNICTIRFTWGSAPFNQISGGNKLVLNIASDCGISGATGGAKTINTTMNFVANSCGQAYSRKVCFDYAVTSACGGNCPVGGFSQTNLVVRRENYGFADNNNDGVPDASGNIDFSKVETKRFKLFDTLSIAPKGVVVTGTSASSYQYAYLESGVAGSLPSGYSIAFLNAEISVKDASTGSTHTYTATSATSIGGNQYRIALHDALPSGTVFENGDSISIKMLVQITNASGIVTNTGNAASTNEVPVVLYMTNTVAPTAANNRYICFNFSDRITIYGDNWGLSLDPININGCANATMGASLQYNVGTNFTTVFPYEVRYLVAPDKVTFTLPTGLKLVNVIINGTGFFGSNMPNGLAVPFTQTGNTAVCDYGALFAEFGGSYRMFDEFISVGTNLTFQNSCSSISGNITSAMTLKSLRANNAVTAAATGSRLASVTVADVSFAALTPTVNTLTSSVEWDIRLQNNATVAASNNWLGFNGSDYTITSVRELVAGTPSGSAFAPSNGIVQLGTINAATTKDYRITATLNNCSPSTLTVSSGWNCAGYPTAIDSAVCSPKTVTLQANLPESEVQLVKVSEPTTAQPLCNNIPFELYVNSAQAGNLSNPVFKMVLPQGMSVAGNFEAEYPRGSGNWSALTNAGTTTAPQYNLNSHPQYPTDGLPGTGTTAATDLRQIGLRFNATSSCTFIPNSRIAFQILSNRPCNQTAVGNGIVLRSSAIQIEGAASTYTANPTLNVNTTSLNCSQTADMTVIFAIVGNSTSSRDSGYVYLPEGFNYVGGSLTCASGACPTFVDVIANPASPSEKIARFKYAEGWLSGTNVNFTFSIMADTLVRIGTKNVLIENRTVTAPLVCNGTVCSGNAIIVTGSTDVNFDVTSSPTFGTLSATLTSNREIVCRGGTVSLTATDINFNLADGCTLEWQSTTDGITWTKIGYATANAFTSPALNATTHFRLLKLCTGANCDVAMSSHITVTVVNDPAVATQPANIVECKDGTTPLSITATGGTPSLNYQWQSSPNGAAWSNISGATSANYTPWAGRVGFTYYRAIVSATGAGCDNATSSSATVKVDPDLLIVTQPQDIQEYLNDAQGLAVITTGGSGTRSYQWQVSTNGTAWTNITGATDSVYVPSAATAGVKYYRVTVSASSNGCDATTSQSAKVEVFNITPTANYTGEYQLKFKALNVDCITKKAYVAVQVRSNSYATRFFLGNAQLKFSYSLSSLRNFESVSQPNASSAVPALDNNYLSQTVTKAAAAGYRESVTVATRYTGANQGAKLIDTNWTTINVFRVDIINPLVPFSLNWDNATLVNELNLVSTPIFGFTTQTATSRGRTDLTTNPYEALVKFRTCPSNIAVTTTTNVAAATWSVPVVTDNCGSTLVYRNFDPGNLFGIGTTQVNYVSHHPTTGLRDTCSFNVVVTKVLASPCDTDRIAPTITNCPKDTTILLATTWATNYSWIPPTITDNCSTPSVQANYRPGAQFGLGNWTVVYTATDRKNNVSTCSFKVNVVRANPCDADTTKPVFTFCPSNITVSAGTGTSATATWNTPTATDNCSTPRLFNTFSPGASFGVGTSTVLYAALDARNNKATCSFTVTVTRTNPTPDLQLTAVANKGEYRNGDNVVYTITIKNFGNAITNNVQVAAPVVNNGLVFQSNTATKGYFNRYAAVWQIGALAPNETAVLVVTSKIALNTVTKARFFQVITQSPFDLDSRPNNNATGMPIEDDEARVVFELEEGTQGFSINGKKVEDVQENFYETKLNLLNVQKTYPNPVEDMLTVQLESNYEGESEWRVFDLNGKMVTVEYHNLAKQVNNITLDLSKLPTGIYTVMPITPSKQYKAIKVVKQ